MTGGDVAAAALETKAIAAIVNAARVTSARFISLCRCRVESKSGDAIGGGGDESDEALA